MNEKKYSKSHEWVAVDGENAVVGITDYAQEQLGDVVFVSMPETGKQVSAGEEAAVIESVKTASEIYSPVSGEIVEVNAALEDAPEKVNSDPLNEGWIYKIKISNNEELDGLMNEAAYNDYLKELH